jgi:hypothetical protein
MGTNSVKPPPRRLPPFAKQLTNARKLGFVPVLPAGYFLICLGWGVHRAIPDDELLPRIVIPLDADTDEFDLRPLAGIDLLLMYEYDQAHRVPDMIEALLKIKPSSLRSDSVDGGAWLIWCQPDFVMSQVTRKSMYRDFHGQA